VICPWRFLARGQVFSDVLHLLTNHEPGNHYHVVSEVQVPGGSVDYFVVSVKNGKAVDFVGVEFQALDTTGTVWPHRQAFLATKRVTPSPPSDSRGFGVNWKMTAKTILVQLHHKLETFEAVNRKLVLVLQDSLMAYMTREFSFGHLGDGAFADPLHFHTYELADDGHSIQLQFDRRKSTDVSGIARALSLGQSGKVELDDLFAKLNEKTSDATRWQPVEPGPPQGAPPPMLPSE
jgi:Restriction endonuclease NotI